ncbi:hypothetical protein EVAR_8246_1 [Eumeta japonica]|uniref:Uncharacterized protein n=1 Tax=Eumeta variegata TaxID=151549 RepID=A0A4C1TGT6_EUMVA|nr:hypothetical protein EVAR_8246_1 [Eumeta japonica]
MLEQSIADVSDRDVNYNPLSRALVNIQESAPGIKDVSICEVLIDPFLVRSDIIKLIRAQCDLLSGLFNKTERAHALAARNGSMKSVKPVLGLVGVSILL